jgi:glucosyl-dolichyl phosphate glucuronosyltransferase
MNITVILCTYNRAQSLSKALASLAASTLPKSIEWEVVVVDNNSKDHTRQVVDEFCRRYPERFRYVFESRQGKSHALTSGIREAAGEILAFMDDDVTVDPDWLQNLTKGLHNGQWAGAGGRILPEQNFQPPGWLPVHAKNGLAPFAFFDLGPQPGALTEPPFGTNMAFQRKLFKKYGGFRTDLGPRPGNEIRNEDTEFGERVLAAGEQLRYEPLAVVYHSIPIERMKKSYFLEWWFDKGRAEIRQCGLPRDTQWFIAGVPLYLFRRLATWTVRWILAIGPSRRFSNKVNMWLTAGRIRECYRHSRGLGGSPV